MPLIVSKVKLTKLTTEYDNYQLLIIGELT